MKRKVIVAAAGVAVVGALIYVGGLVAEQPSSVPARPAAPAVAPRTKIALLNLTYVISYYEKYKAYKEDMKAKAKVYEDKIKGKQAELEAMRKEGTDPKTSAARREEIEKQMRQGQREIEDVSNEGKTVLAKEADAQMVILYREVQDAAQRFAASHDFDLVMHYNEPLENTEYYSAGNVARKMNAGALIPLYYSKGMEISPDVLTMLNASYRPTAGAAAPAGPATPPGGP